MRIFAAAAAVLLFVSLNIAGQRAALLVPEPNDISGDFSTAVEDKLGDKLKVLDRQLAADAARDGLPADPFNMSRNEARRLVDAIGSDLLIVQKAEVTPRSPLSGNTFYEAWAATFVIDKNGSLVSFFIESAKGDNAAAAKIKLLSSAGRAANKITASAERKKGREAADTSLFDLGSDVRSAVPYRRIKPEYTATASAYGVKATVDAIADIGADGSVTSVTIDRWAGFGLDESVINAVRTMNWRPGERNGKPLRMRVLLRYNFVRIQKDHDADQ